MNLQALKADNKSEANGLAIAYDEQKVADKIAALPFTLTGGQRRSLDDILADMRSGGHMNRLLQGDVGSGKTVVASLAMYATYTAGFQSALMVPTEILAEQHFESLTQLFPDLSIAILTSGMKQQPNKRTFGDCGWFGRYDCWYACADSRCGNLPPLGACHY